MVQDMKLQMNTNNVHWQRMNEVIDSALLLTFDATETTPSAIANVLLLMGLHPQVWEDVVDEQKKVAEINGENPTLSFTSANCWQLLTEALLF